MPLFMRKYAVLMVFVLCSLGIATRSATAQEKKEEIATTFKFTETFRSETAGDAERDSAIPKRTETGNYRLEIVMPISDWVPAQIESDDIFGVTMGNLKLEVRASQTMDGKYRRGIRIDYTEGDGTKTPKRIVGKLRIRWTLSKMIMTIEGSATQSGSPAGSLYIEEEPGKFTENTVAAVRFGNRIRQFTVALRGEIKREKRENGDGGTATTVEIAGDGKPLAGSEERRREDKP